MRLRNIDWGTPIMILGIILLGSGFVAMIVGSEIHEGQEREQKEAAYMALCLQRTPVDIPGCQMQTLRYHELLTRDTSDAAGMSFATGLAVGMASGSRR